MISALVATEQTNAKKIFGPMNTIASRHFMRQTKFPLVQGRVRSLK